ncbi:hypothetical protein NAE50_001860 [Salmonella enterica]|nr:hypothetical protein [Salmonella enterica]ELX2844170.1 hypothetical protein [Salmonella enterica]
MISDTSKFCSETKTNGLELLFNLLLSAQPTEVKERVTITGLELIKILKSQPPELAGTGQELCEYLSAMLENSINLS